LHLVFSIPEDWYVCSHRLPLIRAARAQGWRVSVVTRVKDHRAEIEAAGAAVHPISLRRGFRNPVSDALGFGELVRAYRRLRPDILHQVTPKSVLFGSVAAHLAGRPLLVNALAGLGFLFTDESRKVKVVRGLVTFGLRRVLGSRRSWAVVQNEEDRAFFVEELGVPASRLVMIQGAGVDTERFRPAPEPPAGVLRFVLPARLIREKGVYEFAAAAEILREVRPDIRCVLAGASDTENPSGIPAGLLGTWHAAGLLEWLGHVPDMAGLLRRSHAAVLPTYREGFPKALLEAASCGLPLIASDVAGCRPICRDGLNGLLVPTRDPAALAAAMIRLADDPQLRRRFGAASRALVLEHFSEEIVVQQTLDLYRRLLAETGARPARGTR
jgi:glycosyltransferase involved in cell wall biosynthesis